MAFIDIRALLVFAEPLTAFVGLLLARLWWRNRDQYALLYWALSLWLGSIALPLLTARGVVPDWVSIGLANALILLGYGVTWAGARQFEGRKYLPFLTLAGPAVWLLACASPAFFSSQRLRLCMLGLLLATYRAATVLEFYRGQKIQPLPSRPLLIALLSATAILYGVSPLFVLFSSRGDGGTALPASPSFIVIISFNICLTIGACTLLIGLLKERAEQQTVCVLATARDAAAEASEQKTRFLARMSHELRTPLNSVLGLAHLLATDSEQGDRQRRQAATLEQAGHHLLAILNEVLDLSRIEAGRLELSLRPVPLTAFFEETMALVRDDAASRNVRLRLELAPELPATVKIDPTRLRQILLNLLSNALRHTPPEGSVTLTITKGASDWVSCAVADTGPGVPAELQPRLFQDYAQGRGDGSAGGSGLGLAISALLAKAMGGDVVYANHPNDIGCCFTLNLPLPAAAAEPVALGSTPRLAAPGLRILVVDDVAANRDLVEALLRRDGHLVETVADGPSALEAMTRGPCPDVVLLDQSMPGMDGLTVAKRIRAMHGPAGVVPIIAVTASASPEEIMASLDQGMDGHIGKPIDPTALVATITYVIDRTADRRRIA